LLRNNIIGAIKLWIVKMVFMHLMQSFLNVLIRLIFDYRKYTKIINSAVLLCFPPCRQYI